MNLKKIAEFFTANNLWEKPFNQWEREQMLQLGHAYFESVVPESRCRFTPELFARLIDEGVLPAEKSGCPLAAVCKGKAENR